MFSEMRDPSVKVNLQALGAQILVLGCILFQSEAFKGREITKETQLLFSIIIVALEGLLPIRSRHDLLVNRKSKFSIEKEL